MKEQSGDESIFLRISELKRGNVQFTDSTNASWLIREHGRDIRYNTAWKKWLVWGDTHWPVDEGGALIHEKNLEAVRNIYDELARKSIFIDDPKGYSIIWFKQTIKHKFGNRAV
jgi:putative DNA primase/helicase